MAGTVTFTQDTGGHVRTVVATCTGDAADGTIPATALPKIEGHLYSIRTNPGAVAPTDNYDITLIDQDGIDRLQGLGLNRDTANSEEAHIVFSGTAVHPPVDTADTLTLTVANTSVNSAVIVVTLTYTAAA